MTKCTFEKKISTFNMYIWKKDMYDMHDLYDMYIWKKEGKMINKALFITRFIVVTFGRYWGKKRVHSWQRGPYPPPPFPILRRPLYIAYSPHLFQLTYINTHIYIYIHTRRLNIQVCELLQVLTEVVIKRCFEK